MDVQKIREALDGLQRYSESGTASARGVYVCYAHVVASLVEAAPCPACAAGICPACTAYKKDDHNTGCAIAAALADGGGGDA